MIETKEGSKIFVFKLLGWLDSKAISYQSLRIAEALSSPGGAVRLARSAQQSE